MEIRQGSHVRAAIDEGGGIGDEITAKWRAAMRRRGLADGTVYKRGCELRAWRAFIGAGWRTATRQDVERWLDSRPLEAGARYAAISHLHAFYRWAQREAFVDQDPTVLVERPRLPGRLPRPARTHIVDRIVLEAREPWRLAFALAGYAGLRCCELARLTWDDVDLDAGTVFVTGKGDRDRVVPIAPVLRVVLAGSDHVVGPVVPNARGGRFTPARLSQRGNDLLRELGAGVTMHQLRHHAATVFLRLSGGDITVVQMLLGHSSIATTQVYAKVDPESVRRAAARWS